MANLRIHLFGLPTVELDGENVPIIRRKAMAMLAYLAVEPGVHGRDTLAALLWPGYDQPTARGNLRRTLSILNTSLGHGWLDLSRETVELPRTAGVTVDVNRFEKLLQGCRVHDHAPDQPCAHCRQCLAQAAGLYRDDFLAGFVVADSPEFEAWQRQQSEVLRREFGDDENDLEQLASPTFAWLAEAKAILESYGSHVTRYLGDGLLAVFGIDQMHEDDAERALRAALQIRDAAERRRTPVGSGIHTGRVYVPPPSGEGEQPAILGTVINRAARLCDLAGRDEVLLSRQTYDLTRRAIRAAARSVDFGALGGTDQVYALERIRRRTRRTHGIEGRRAPLVGRAREVAVVNRALGDLQAGVGGVILLSGEAGIGKSRLVEELEETASAQPSTLLWLEGRCLEMSAASAYAPFASLFQGYFSSLDNRPQPSLAVGVRTTLQTLVDAGAISDDQRNEIGPLFGRLLSLQFDDAWDNTLAAADPQQIQYRTHMAICEFLTALAGQQPLVVVLEDLHWADDLSLDLAAELMSIAVDNPLLLCCVYRPSTTHRSRQLAKHAMRRSPNRLHEIRLVGLPPDTVRLLVSSLLNDVEADASLLDQILGRAQGNPFFIEEIVRSVQESGVLGRAGDGDPLNLSGSRDAIPVTLQSVILSRVDRLDSAERQLLRRLAVVGRSFNLALIEQIAADERLPMWLASLEDRGFLFLERSLPVPAYAFWHVLTQQTVYSSLTRRERAALHRQVAEVIEGLYADSLDAHLIDLAYHYDRSDQTEKAIDYLLRAGEKLRVAYANEGAIAHFQRVLTRLDEPDLQNTIPPEILYRWRYLAHGGMGRVYTATADLANGETHLTEALRLARVLDLEPKEIVRAINALGELLTWRNKHDAVTELADEAFSLLGEEPSIEMACTNHLVWLSQSTLVAAPWAGLEYVRRNAQFLADLPYVEELRPSYFGVTTYYLITKQPVCVRHWYDLFRRRSQEKGDLCGFGEALLQWAIVLWACGNYSGALDYLERTVDQMASIGDRLRSAWGLSIAAYIQLSVGMFDAASRALGRRDQLSIAAWHGSVHDSDYVKSILDLVAGDVVGAEAKVAKTFWYSGDGPAPARVVISLHRAELSSIQNRPLAAIAAIEEAIRVTFEAPLIPPALWYGGWSSILIRIPLAEGLSKYESVSADAALFRARCREWRDRYPDIMPEFTHWQLAPTQIPAEFDAGDIWLPTDDMVWSDPLSDSAYKVGGVDGSIITLRAANGRDLWQLNRSAPRLLRPISGDFALAATVAVAQDDRPAMGGLLLWQDEENYLCLSWGQRRPDEISFEGNIGNRDLIFGRGKLPGDRIRLRLERSGLAVRALCCADGKQWFTAGTVTLSGGESLQAGIYAAGTIDRAVYRGAFADGTAIGFDQVQIQYRDN